MRNTVVLPALLLAAVLATGCDQDGPAERAGESIDDVVEDISDGGKDLAAQARVLEGVITGMGFIGGGAII